MFTEFIGKYFNEETWLYLSETIIKIIVVLVLSKVIIKIGKKMLRKVFLVRAKSPFRTNERRESTLLKLLENIITYVVYFVSAMMILEYCGIPIKGLLAGAGILGLAVGFGAQSLVKDIISGFFVIFEDQFSVGDYIKINPFEGEVLEIGLRTTKLKSKTGELHVIPNGSIIQVTNYSILNSVSIVDVTIPNDQKSELAEKLIQQQLSGLETKVEDIVTSPVLTGIETHSPEGLVLRIVTETKPLKEEEVSPIDKARGRQGRLGAVPRDAGGPACFREWSVDRSITVDHATAPGARRYLGQERHRDRDHHGRHRQRAGEVGGDRGRPLKAASLSTNAGGVGAPRERAMPPRTCRRTPRPRRTCRRRRAPAGRPSWRRSDGSRRASAFVTCRRWLTRARGLDPLRAASAPWPPAQSWATPRGPRTRSRAGTAPGRRAAPSRTASTSSTSSWRQPRSRASRPRVLPGCSSRRSRSARRSSRAGRPQSRRGRPTTGGTSSRPTPPGRPPGWPAGPRNPRATPTIRSSGPPTRRASARLPRWTPSSAPSRATVSWRARSTVGAGCRRRRQSARSSTRPSTRSRWSAPGSAGASSARSARGASAAST